MKTAVKSEGPIKITKATVDAAWKRRAPHSRLVLRDKECRGLTLIVNPTTMAWVFAYRPRGTDPLTGRRWPNRTITLGNPGSLSPDDARVEVNRLKGEAIGGVDPAEAKKARAQAAQRRRATTLGRLLDEYKKVLPRRPKMRGAGLPSPTYVAEELAQTRMALAEMDATDKPAAELTDADVLKLVSDAEGVTTARKRYASLSRFLDWCRDEKHIQANPCLLIARARRPKAPQARSEYLEPAALTRLWTAADALNEPVWRDLVRFLIALPCRRGEATSLDWSHIDLAKGEWRQPDKLTKNRDPHRLHLHPLAQEILKTRWRAWAEAEAGGNHDPAARSMVQGTPRSGLVFPAPRSGKEIDTFTDIKADLMEAAKLPDGDGDTLTGWTWHDFRRSFASALGEASIPEAVADAVLNHRQAATRGGVLGVYQRSSRWPEQVRAMQLWGRLLQDALDGKQSDANVVAMAARAS
ncbi:MAG TPA: integrase arm-type DNA-binding domain-containing protein [Rhodopila sp.]|nr:integrase arm-type DNA-binding domain-containing protein [Rhodopila sp.]